MARQPTRSNTLKDIARDMDRLETAIAALMLDYSRLVKRMQQIVGGRDGN